MEREHVMKGVELHSGVREVWDWVLPLPFTFWVPLQASGFSPGKGGSVGLLDRLL